MPRGNEADSSHKAPRQPDATFARVNDPSTYSTFDQALEAIQPGGSCQGGGVGFIVTAGRPVRIHRSRPCARSFEWSYPRGGAGDSQRHSTRSPESLHPAQGCTLSGKGRKPSGWGNGPYQLVQGKPGTIEVYDGHAVVGSASSGSGFTQAHGGLYRHFLEGSSVNLVRRSRRSFSSTSREKEGHSIATMDATSPSVEIPSYLPAPDEIRCEIMTSDDEKNDSPSCQAIQATMTAMIQGLTVRYV